MESVEQPDLFNMSYRCYEAPPLLGVITRRKLVGEIEAVVNGL